MTTIMLPTTADGVPRLPAGVRAVPYDVSAPPPPEAADADALVVWGNPGDRLAELAAAARRARWVQTLAAGPDAVLAAGFADDVVVTNGRGLHDATVAEHVLALVLACVRRVPDLVRAHDAHRWAGELGGLQPLHPPGEVRTLLDAHVTVWGFGSIAARLAPLLHALGADVTGVARTAGERHGFPVVTPDALADLLPGTDVLVTLLPDLPATRHAVDARVLGLLPARAWVVNAGRGSTLDEDALLAAVREERLAGAALDVVATEPLPASSPLWDEPRVLVSPHAAGGRPVGWTELVADNVARFVAGRPLRNVVERGARER
ncbi:NAD(P)-dependent oxidoreductase [Cellulomonas shaoxiangyii]|uniref:Phosphoglycerate dehydrogenase n=1 Tax=Cellulomonas shaoxiangyii TaxID=2566013 RepID=A0A4P7SHN6_9CELL|nr:NAD(P)-dependent oxidoreductase [Cellulomonas shaoxiangyii]QCB93201.1 phosphoglycerate dehydrogenase [Cellulomonas shaoxiangyii]TGY80679.1 phosphoglycerate dehydrogenase [Cellulomonas shaoxiangyii]